MPQEQQQPGHLSKNWRRINEIKVAAKLGQKAAMKKVKTPL